jgi:hypothetical protein
MVSRRLSLPINLQKVVMEDVETKRQEVETRRQKSDE